MGIGEAESLSDIAKFINDDKLTAPPTSWGQYFQSPVDKTVALFQNKGQAHFQFDEVGALQSDTVDVTKNILENWLDLKKDNHHDELRNWLNSGQRLGDDLFQSIQKKLSAESVSDADLYNRPICRLVYADQLRYDPDYQVVYQLTPAQSSLLSEESRPGLEYAQKVERNQLLYWTISELSQSLIALFDSDLGRKYEKGGVTKEFITLTERNKEHLTPHELNQFSPLRFWSPPTAFAASVFHMLFWRPIITCKDLYGRTVIGETPEERASHYYVCVNYFNATKFRIANYANLLEGLFQLSNTFDSEVSKACKDLDDIILPESFSSRHRERSKRLPQVELTVPCRNLCRQEDLKWDLARPYMKENEDTKIEHFLKMIRDRMLELILWSRYQMEVRSVGIVPIQCLYQVKLTERGINFIKSLPTDLDERQSDTINKRFCHELTHAGLLEMVQLQKEYDRQKQRSISKDGPILWVKRWRPGMKEQAQ